MGRKAIMGGIRPKGLRRIQFDFEIDGVRFRPTLSWVPTPANLEQAQKLNARIKAQIEAPSSSRRSSRSSGDSESYPATCPRGAAEKCLTSSSAMRKRA